MIHKFSVLLEFTFDDESGVVTVSRPAKGRSILTTSDELDYILDLMADLDLSPTDNLQNVIDALKAEADDD